MTYFALVHEQLVKSIGIDIGEPGPEAHIFLKKSIYRHVPGGGHTHSSIHSISMKETGQKLARSPGDSLWGGRIRTTFSSIEEIYE